MIQNLENTKCVLIVDSSLTIGEQANVAAVLAMTIGAKNSEIIGADVADADDFQHKGITRLNLPVLTASVGKIRDIHDSASADSEVFLVDFTDAAQRSRTYDEYSSRMATLSAAELRYIGIGIIGHKKSINKYSGSLKLLR